MFGEPVAELALDLVELLVDGVQRAKLLEELAGGLLADAGTPGMLSEVSPLSTL